MFIVHKSYFVPLRVFETRKRDTYVWTIFVVLLQYELFTSRVRLIAFF